MSPLRSKIALCAAALVAGSVLTACTESKSGGGGDSAGVDLSSLEEGYLGEQASDADATDGGTLTWAAFAEPSSLDPKVTITALTTGGVEMLNLYDSLMRYDAGGQEFVPQLAESLETSDNVTWTLTLREGVTFSNGKPFDAAAVKASQERYAEGGPEAALWNANVTAIATPDDRTVVYTLAKPWAQFPGLLTTGPGLIVGPGSGEGESFKPVGAGPFTLGEWRPQESITLEAREDYWGGTPHLDAVQTVFLPDADTAIDSFDQGDVDMIFVREPDQVEEVLADDPRGYVNFTAAQNSALINASPGRPGEDVRVRRAMQLALNTEVLTQRAFNGASGGTSTIFPEYSRWHGETEGLPYDPEQAKELLAEAKADGFDGKVTYADMNDPASRETALAVKAMFESVGFDVETHNFRSVADMITAVAVQQDYDVVAWGHSFREADPLPKMYSLLHSKGTQVYGASTSPEMDALLERFQSAESFDEQHAVMQEVQAHVNEEVPFLAFGPFAEILLWQDSVGGIQGTANSMVFFGSAWKK